MQNHEKGEGKYAALLQSVLGFHDYQERSNEVERKYLRNFVLSIHSSAPSMAMQEGSEYSEEASATVYVDRERLDMSSSRSPCIHSRQRRPANRIFGIVARP